MRLLRAAVALTFALAVVLFCQAGAQSPQRPERLITLDAEDAYLPSVLKILAEKGDLNIITGPGVSAGRLSIHMRDVPVDEAVNLVVRAAGLAYERIGNSILVAEPRSLEKETGLSSYVVDLQYADANDVKTALKQLAAQIEVDRGGNRLIVVTSPRVISEIRNIVAQLDRPAKQVMLEARVVEVSVDDTKELGIDWDLLNRQTFIVVEGLPSASTGTGTGAGVIEGTEGTSKTDQLPESMPYIKGPPRANSIRRQAKAIQAAIDLLVREGNARVLANPKIATLNGKEATMLIGSRIPFVVTGTTFAGGGAAATQSVQREEVGIKLRITPLINADGYITTEINPEVSSVTDFRGENADLPVVATRQASTTVRLKDGDSVIIGGLLSEEKTRTVTKVPILGQIPGIGYLFQHHTIISSKRDLVIEVTPRIMTDQP